MMGAMPPSAAPGPWRCPRCGSDRDAADAFCGQCATRRPTSTGPDAEVGADTTAGRPAGFPVRRALILNGIVLGAVLIAVMFSRDAGPGTIAFVPASWRCDGTERAWTAAIPAAHESLAIEWRSGGPEGGIRTRFATTRTALETYRQPDGTFRVAATETDAPECSLPPDRYTMVVRDAVSNALVASGDVELAP